MAAQVSSITTAPALQVQLETPPSQVSGAIKFTAYTNLETMEVEFLVKDDQATEMVRVGGWADGQVPHNGGIWYFWHSDEVMTDSWSAGTYHVQAVVYPFGSNQPQLSTTLSFAVKNETNKNYTFVWESPATNPSGTVSGSLVLTVKTEPAAPQLEFELRTPADRKVRLAAQTDTATEPGVFRYRWEIDPNQWSDGTYQIIPYAKDSSGDLASGPVRTVTVDGGSTLGPVTITADWPQANTEIRTSLSVRASLGGGVQDEICLFRLERVDSQGGWTVADQVKSEPGLGGVCDHSFYTAQLPAGSYRLLAEAISPVTGVAAAVATVTGLTRPDTSQTEPLPTGLLVVELLEPVANAQVAGEVGLRAWTNQTADKVQAVIRPKLSLSGVTHNQTSLMLERVGTKEVSGVVGIEWAVIWHSASSGLQAGEYVIELTAMLGTETATSAAVPIQYGEVTTEPDPPPANNLAVEVVAPTLTEANEPLSGKIRLAAKADFAPTSVTFYIKPVVDERLGAGPEVAPLNATLTDAGLWEAVWATDQALDWTYELWAEAKLDTVAGSSVPFKLQVLHPTAPFRVTLGELAETVSDTVTLQAKTEPQAAQLKFEIDYVTESTTSLAEPTTISANAVTVTGSSTDGQLWVGQWDTTAMHNGLVVVRALATAGQYFANDSSQTKISNETEPEGDYAVTITVAEPEPGQQATGRFRLQANTDQRVGLLTFVLVHRATGDRQVLRAVPDSVYQNWTTVGNTDQQPLAVGEYRLVARAFSGSTTVGVSEEQLLKVVRESASTPEPEPEPEPEPQPETQPDTEVLPPGEGLDLTTDPGSTTESDPTGEPEPALLPPSATDSDTVAFVRLVLPAETLTGDVRLVAVTSLDVTAVKFLVVNSDNHPVALEGKPVDLVPASDSLSNAELFKTTEPTLTVEPMAVSEMWKRWTAVWQTRRHDNGAYRLTVQALDDNQQRLARPEPLQRRVANPILQPDEEVNLREIVISDPDAVLDSVWSQPDPDRLIKPIDLPHNLQPSPEPEDTTGNEESPGSQPDPDAPDGEKPGPVDEEAEDPNKAETVDWDRYPPRHPDCVQNGIAANRCEQWLAFQNQRTGDSRCMTLGITIKEECLGYLQQRQQTETLTEDEIAKETAGLLEKDRFDRVQTKMISLVGRTIDLRVRLTDFASVEDQDPDAVSGPERPEPSNFAQPALDPFEDELKASLGEAGFDREEVELELGEFIPIKSKRDRKIRLHGSPAYVKNAEGLVQSQMPALVMIDDDGDGLPNDTERRLGTDPFNADSDGDGYGDWQELRNGFDPLKPAGRLEDSDIKVKPVDAAIISGAPLDQPRTAGTVDGSLQVDTVEFFDEATTVETPSIRLTGKAKPGETITIYVYSYLPLVLTTTAKDDGTWSYDLEDGVADGQHEVYVAVTDDTGRIQGKSQPLGFLVTEARAATEEEYFSPTVLAAAQSPINRFMMWYMVGAGILILGGAVIGGLIFTRATRRHSDSY